VIASVGPNLPQDLFAATGRYAGPLPVDPDGATPNADKWMESKFAPWAKAMLEAWSRGEFDRHECVVFSRADDSAQRLYYYVCELQRMGSIAGPRAIMFDIARSARPASFRHTVEQVRKLAALLGLSDAALERSIAETNRKRTQAGDLPAGRRCLLSGTAPPDRRLHRAIEASGFVAVGETLSENWTQLGEVVEEDTGDPASAIGLQLFEDPLGPRGLGDPAEMLLEDLRRAEAAAVVLWRIEEDEAQAWHLPAQRRMLEQSGVPSLILTRRDWRGDDGAGDEISAFLREVNA
jgi:hypothetical protein